MEDHTTYTNLCDSAESLAEDLHEADNAAEALCVLLTKLQDTLIELERERARIEATLGAVVEKRDRLSKFYPVQEDFDPVFGF